MAKSRRGAKEMNNYQSYRTKKDTLSLTVFTAFIFPLFCDITTRYHFAVCSFLRRHVISAQTKPREYLTGNDQSQRTYYSVYFIQFIISLFYIFICFNNFVFMVFFNLHIYIHFLFVQPNHVDLKSLQYMGLGTWRFGTRTFWGWKILHTE